VVPALRHVDLRPRARRLLRRSRRSVHLRAPAAEGAARRVTPDLDDDAVDAAGGSWGPSSSAGATRGRSTIFHPAPPSTIASSPGTRSRSTRDPGSSTSPRAAARRTSSSPACTTCPC
jgi:hypothetical protein